MNLVARLNAACTSVDPAVLLHVKTAIPRRAQAYLGMHATIKRRGRCQLRSITKAIDDKPHNSEPRSIDEGGAITKAIDERPYNFDQRSSDERDASSGAITKVIDDGPHNFEPRSIDEGDASSGAS
ncbi:hypothetical protein TNCV_4044191 [Trichonephila clavipes]|nr:hypothetical protein TNCV_4044191 [Trichonephila clavipes]